MFYICGVWHLINSWQGSLFHFAINHIIQRVTFTKK